LILGGETTVTVKGDGLGGRNQELALAAAVALDGWPATVIASFATDGEDGPTAAAGAVVTGDTVKSGRNFGLDPVAYLDGNDSFHFFQRLDEGLSEVRGQQALLITGPTGTNVNDLLFLLTYPCEDG
jgi:glycerate-2-kinase